MSHPFRTVPHILAGVGSAAQLGDHIVFRRPLIVTDKGVRAAGVVEQVIRPFEQRLENIAIFDNVESDPSDETIREALLTAHIRRVDGVIGIGGGSAMDVAKLVATLAVGMQSLEDIYGVDKVRYHSRLPLVQIPTTAGTGSEVTPIAIVTAGDEKKGIVSPQLMADIAVIDGGLTGSVPAKVAAASGIDAMVHAIEAYTSRLRKNPISDGLAREALGLLHTNIAVVHADPTDVDARQAMLLGAMMAGQAFANAPVGGVHALAYPLGALFHVPHGLSNSLVLPHVMRVNSEQAAPLYAELSREMGLASGADDVEAADQLIESLATLPQELDLPVRLRDTGVSAQDVSRLAADAMRQERLLVNNPVAITQQTAEAVYEAAY